ncbi:exo-rhamnogalacturonan lyase family protein [Enterococcus timonensis]|uniref:exo-rhamnogalacturonan lyase family protein n=1 Tax=Enterococcus timonensis TaxID=1852364 RepID=UPI0008D9E7CA|nr:hypothetical protein [Enterococcus timonensis]
MSIKWLKKSPSTKRGLTFGYPLTQGQLTVDQVPTVAQMGAVALQTKIMAYWPDKSIKWLALSGVVEKDTKISKISFSQRKDAKKIIAEDKYNGVYIDNGLFQAYFPKHAGKNVVLDWLKCQNEIKLQRLFITSKMADKQTISQVEQVELEENGSIKAVVKITGGLWLNGIKVQKFCLRFKFFRNAPNFDVQHTVTILSEESVSDIFLQSEVPLVGNDFNRRISFVGEEGVYTEPARLLLSRRFWKNNHLYQKQLAGENVVFTTSDEQLLESADDNALWDNFFLTQTNARAFRLEKQTKSGYTPIDIGYGDHAQGTVYLGGEKGGVAFGLEKFWQKAPRAIEVSGLSQKNTQIKMHFWSEKGGTMNFTHYSDTDHMFSAYEGMEEIRSTPVGIANSDNLRIEIFTDSPSQEEILDFAQEVVNPSHLVLDPKDYLQTKVFGNYYSLPDEKNVNASFLEKQMVTLRNFYINEVKQRDWYGFWNYGDVMHTYDADRHTWRYDLGGFAWQNTELVPNIWLWLDFLRTGSAEVFELAEAMTRHTSEVDQYHEGQYRGLGSRHNVLHWGCQCKEARISMAGLHRYYYYLTGDERTGEIMESVKDNEQQIFDELPPLREFYPPQIENKYPIRVGPDWASLTSNWFTQWERTGDVTYLNKILTGIQDIKNAPDHLLSGPTYLFDKKKKSLEYMGTGNVGGYHMIISFGAPEVWLEIAENIQDSEWTKAIAEFGRFYALSDEEMITQSKGKLSKKHFSWPMFATGLMAYAASTDHDENLAQKAWQILLTPSISGVPLPIEETFQDSLAFKKVTELPWISTNVASQWCLNTILCLRFIGGSIPAYDKNKMEEKR